MVRKDEDTTLPIKKETRDRLGTFGSKKETWDQIVNRLMDEVEERRTKDA